MKDLALGYYNTVQRVVAKISGFHGVKGEIKFFPLVDDINSLNNLEQVWIDGQNYEVESQRNHKKWLLVKLVGFDDLNSVEHFNGNVEAEIEEDDNDSGFYIADLIDLKVVDENDELVGKVVNYSSQAQDHIFIELDAKFAAKSELILPFVEEYILELRLGDCLRIKLDKDLLELCQ